MGKNFLIVLSLLNAALVATSVGAEQSDEASTYIVHVVHAHAANTVHLAQAHYTSFLQRILPSHMHGGLAPRLVYAYSHAATGFAACMTKHQAAHITDHPGVLAIYPDEHLQLHTTQSPSFLRLSPSVGLVQASNGGGTGAVIVILDTGIYPKGRRSFTADSSFPPPPRTFRGHYVSTRSFNATAYCNNKLVGAKFFYKGHEAMMGRLINETQESKSPLDTEGHGTHTASTAAGSAVPSANFVGYANGTAQGMAVRAHIASYKVCWRDDGNASCATSDILAGMNEAIADGVDVISLSLGGLKPQLYNEPTSLGAFNAIRRGIVVSTSAGNDGPGTMLSSNMVTGKIVLCYGTKNTTNPIVQEAAVQQAGGVGAIISIAPEYGDFLQSSADILPTSTITFKDTETIHSYTQSVADPVARIDFLGTVINQPPSAPRVAAFSSRGPNRFAPEILKPDMIAPGVDILAAWTREMSSTMANVIDNRRVEFNIISGTSMACPHSAMMTTAYNVDNDGNAIKDMATGQAAGPFELGSGHVDPNRALDPGLVYNTTADDYITFLCSLGYNSSQIALFTNDGSTTDCSTRPRRSVGDLNYPAFSVVFARSGEQVTQRRAVTNVGANTNVVYNVTITAPPGTTLTVTPTRLAFDAQRRTLDYSITVSAGATSSSEHQWGSIVWSDGQHTVRSPVVATWQ
uniref:Subtilisin-like protease n=1 Tax=Oryza barthii TaxID=65489 RepID=A0A0D3FB74_9ORYZ